MVEAPRHEDDGCFLDLWRSDPKQSAEAARTRGDGLHGGDLDVGGGEFLENGDGRFPDGPSPSMGRANFLITEVEHEIGGGGFESLDILRIEVGGVVPGLWGNSKG